VACACPLWSMCSDWNVGSPPAKNGMRARTRHDLLIDASAHLWILVRGGRIAMAVSILVKWMRARMIVYLWGRRNTAALKARGQIHK
jgi:fatty acid-binding protein DegV